MNKNIVQLYETFGRILPRPLRMLLDMIMKPDTNVEQKDKKKDKKKDKSGKSKKE